MVRIVPLDEAGLPQLVPGLQFDGRVGDLAINPLDHPDNPGDLWTDQALATAVLICLMTDRRVDPSELRDGDENRGWPGDVIALDANDRPLGSKLWLLRRSALTDGIEQRAEDYAAEALQTLIDQDACARVSVEADVRRDRNRLDLAVSLFGRDGRRTYHKRFGVLWDALTGVSKPLEAR